MKLNQLTPLGVLRRKSLSEALFLLGQPLSANIDATGNTMAVDAVLRDSGVFVRVFGQTLTITPGSGIYVVVDKQVHDGFNGPWTEGMEVSLVRSRQFTIQTGEITLNTKAGGDFGSQPCKVKLSLTLKLRGEARYVRRALDEERLEEFLKKDVLVVAETFEAWFGQQTVEEIIAKQEAGDIPNVMNLELSDYDHEWTFHVTAADIASLSHSKVVNEGLAKIKQKQQARQAALDGLASSIKKILPGRPTALKAMLDSIAAEYSNGNITSEEADGFGESAHQAEENRIKAEAEDKRLQAEAGIVVKIAQASEPEHFVAIHTAIGEAVDIIGDERANELKAESQAAFAAWFKASLKSAKVPADFSALKNLAEQYKMFLAEADAQALPTAIDAELTSRAAAVKRQREGRVSVKAAERSEDLSAELRALVELSDPAWEDAALVTQLIERQKKAPERLEAALLVRGSQQRGVAMKALPSRQNPKPGDVSENGKHVPEQTVDPVKIQELTERLEAVR